MSEDKSQSQSQSRVTVGLVPLDDIGRDVWEVVDAARFAEIARGRGGRSLGVGLESRELRAQRRRQRQAEERLAAVSPQRWGEISRAVTDHVVRRVRSTMTHRHPFHLEVLDEIEEVVELVLEHVGEVYLGEDPTDFQFATTVDTVPQVAQRIDADAIEEFIREGVEHYQVVAAGSQLLTEWRDEQVLVVQHQASGLRARFTVEEDGFGSVYSKSYKIRSIDPRDDGRVGGDRIHDFYGLGIGEQLYLRGAEEIPGVRWMSGVSSVPAKRVRRRLHRRDPYVWEGQCHWCAERKILWELAGAAQFAGHPRW